MSTAARCLLILPLFHLATLRAEEVTVSGPRVRILDPAFAMYPRAASPDGKWLAVSGTTSETSLYALNGKEPRRVVLHQSSLLAAAFSPDGKQLVTSTSDRTVRLWDVESGKQMRQMAQSTSLESFTAVAWGGGTILAAARSTIWIWEKPEGGPRKITASTASGRALAVSADGKLFATTGSRTAVWDVATGKELAGAAAAGFLVETAIAFQADGSRLATWGGRGVNFRSVKTAAIERTVGPPTGTLRLSCFASSGKLLATRGDYDTAITIWDVATGKVVASLAQPGTLVWMAFLANGDLLTADGAQLRRWDLSLLNDPKGLAMLQAMQDGDKDNFAAFLRQYASGKKDVKGPPSLSSGKGDAVQLTTKSGVTIDAADITLGSSRLALYGFTFRQGVRTVTVPASNLRSVEVKSATPGTTSVKVVYTDRKEDEGTIDATQVSGRSAWGAMSVSLSQLTRLTFDGKAVGATASGAQPADSPTPVEVRDLLGGRVVATDLSSGYYGGARRELPVAIDSVTYQLPARLLKSVRHLAPTKGGVLVRLTLRDGSTASGWISQGRMSQLEGRLTFGTFRVAVNQIESLTFP